LRHMKTTKHPKCTDLCSAYQNPKFPDRIPTSKEIDKNMSISKKKSRPSLLSSGHQMELDVDEVSQNLPSSSSFLHPYSYPTSFSSNSFSNLSKKSKIESGSDDDDLASNMESLYVDDTKIPSVVLKNNNNTLNIGYVLDFIWYLARYSAENDIIWIKAVLSGDEVEMLEDLSLRAFHVVNQRKRPKTSILFNVLIQEWVSQF
jgi:hypothetical protein